MLTSFPPQRKPRRILTPAVSQHLMILVLRPGIAHLSGRSYGCYAMNCTTERFSFSPTECRIRLSVLVCGGKCGLPVLRRASLAQDKLFRQLSKPHLFEGDGFKQCRSLPRNCAPA